MYCTGNHKRVAEHILGSSRNVVVHGTIFIIHDWEEMTVFVVCKE